MSFNHLDLHADILKAVAEAGYTHPTEVQKQVIPKVISGCDIKASAQTGTGKTAAFLLPVLNRLVAPGAKPGRGPRVLILVPTRELAMQVAEQSQKYSKYLHRIKTVCVVGGVPYHAQMRQLLRPYDILIATPGRLIDFIQQRKVDFSRVEMLVLDEADRMLDMGFVEPVENIVAKTPSSRQTLLFSATLQGSVVKLSEKLLKNPLEIAIHAEKAKHDNIEQKLYYVDNLNHKNRLLEHILNEDNVHAIVFTATKRHADQLVRELKDKGFQAGALHGDMNQSKRTKTIFQLKKGQIKILVATDVAARGIDVQSITHIVNFDLPQTAEDYVHRIGRTGRAGANGIALSFVSGRDQLLVKDIEKFTGHKINVAKIIGLEPSGKRQSPLAHSKPSFHSRRGPRRFEKSRGHQKRNVVNIAGLEPGKKKQSHSEPSPRSRRGPKRFERSKGYKKNDVKSVDLEPREKKHAHSKPSPHSHRGPKRFEKSKGHKSDIVNIAGLEPREKKHPYSKPSPRSRRGPKKGFKFGLKSPKKHTPFKAR